MPKREGLVNLVALRIGGDVVPPDLTRKVSLINPSMPYLQRITPHLTRAFDPESLLEEARHALEGVKFDTMVGIGLSGTLVIPTFARALNKNFVIVRKDRSEYTSQTWEGRLGHRWIFVDDLIASGETYARVKTAVRDISTRYGWDTKHVGILLYLNIPMDFREVVCD